MSTTCLLAGGGTGGHLYPLVATCRAILQQYPSVKIVVLLSKADDPSELTSLAHHVHTVRKIPLPKSVNIAAVLFPFRLLLNVLRVAGILRKYRVDIVVGFGAYIAASAYVASRLRVPPVPVVAHEANARIGAANKFALKFCKAFASALPLQLQSRPGCEYRSGIMPIRHEISQAQDPSIRARAHEFFGLDPDKYTLLVLGGSLGAQNINTALEGSANFILKQKIAGRKMQILHITGKQHMPAHPHPQAPDSFPPASAGYVRIPYCTDMHMAYAASDIIISRAGGSTLAEIAHLGIATICVPYKYGGGEQLDNIFGFFAPADSRGAASAHVEGDFLQIRKDVWLVLDDSFNADWIKLHFCIFANSTLGGVNYSDNRSKRRFENGAFLLTSLIFDTLERQKVQKSIK